MPAGPVPFCCGVDGGAAVPEADEAPALCFRRTSLSRARACSVAAAQPQHPLIEKREAGGSSKGTYVPACRKQHGHRPMNRCKRGNKRGSLRVHCISYSNRLFSPH